jgi:hypothetical protein
MKTIIVINDGSPSATHASKQAFAIARAVQANILVADTYEVNTMVSAKVLAGHSIQQPLIAGDRLARMLNALNQEPANYHPEISAMDIADFDATQLAAMIIKNDIWLMVSGSGTALQNGPRQPLLNLQSVLNKVQCPLLIVPENWTLKNIQHITYMADLRYCRAAVVKYLVQLAEPMQASVAVAHLSAKGIPDIEESYGQQLFTERVGNHIRNFPVAFNNIREKDINKALDVIINGMHNDVLVLVNHRYHFKEIIGDYLTEALPGHITIPLLIFPY